MVKLEVAFINCTELARVAVEAVINIEVFVIIKVGVTIVTDSVAVVFRDSTELVRVAVVGVTDIEVFVIIGVGVTIVADALEVAFICSAELAGVINIELFLIIGVGVRNSIVEDPFSEVAIVTVVDTFCMILMLEVAFNGSTELVEVMEGVGVSSTVKLLMVSEDVIENVDIFTKELIGTGVSLKNGLIPDPTSSDVEVGVAVIKDVNIVEGDGVICPIELVVSSVTLDVTATVLLTRGVLGVIL